MRSRPRQLKSLPKTIWISFLRKIKQSLKLNIRGFSKRVRGSHKPSRSLEKGQGKGKEFAAKQTKQKVSPLPLLLLPRPQSRSKLGTAARLPHFFGAWTKVTSNNFILNIVKFGYKLQFISSPFQNFYSPRTYSPNSLSITKAKVEELLYEGAIIEVNPSSDQFLSHIFPVPKRTPGEFRIIFDLS